MGVPVVTLVSASHHAHNVGETLLHHVSHPEWIARSEAEYVRLACELASDVPQLDSIRAQLRQDFMQSRLLNAPEFTRDLEDAFSEMWKRFVDGRSSSEKR